MNLNIWNVTDNIVRFIRKYISFFKMFTLLISHMIFSNLVGVEIIGVLRSFPYENYERIWVLYCTDLIKGEFLSMWMICDYSCPALT